MESQKEMVEFVNGISTNVKGFENASPEEIVTALNGMAQSEEGKKSLQDLVTKFKASKKKQMFQFGGILPKFENGTFGTLERQIKPRGLKAWGWEPTFHPRLDGEKGGVAEYLDGADTVTIITGPYTKYTRVSKPNGSITYEVARNGQFPKYYDPKETDHRPGGAYPIGKDTETDDLPWMFRNTRKRFK